MTPSEADLSRLVWDEPRALQRVDYTVFPGGHLTLYYGGEYDILGEYLICYDVNATAYRGGSREEIDTVDVSRHARVFARGQEPVEIMLRRTEEMRNFDRLCR